jgi:gliding motility-associated-like protein
MNNYSRFFKKFLFVGLLAMLGVMNGYGQDSDCVCIQNDDSDFLIPSDCVEYTNLGSIPGGQTRCITDSGTETEVDLNLLGTGSILHITATNREIIFRNNGNNVAKIYIHEKANVRVTGPRFQNISVYNRGTLTTDGPLEMNGELLNVGKLIVNGKLGNINHRFSNYGNAEVKGQLGEIQGNQLCLGSNSVITVETLGDFNATADKAITTTGSGGNINVLTGFGNFNNRVSSSDNLHIWVASQSVLNTGRPINDPLWGTAEVKIGLYHNCDFIPIIAPNTFTPGTPTLFTVGYLVPGIEATSPIYQWMINDTPIAGATGASYTAILGEEDKISCAVSNGDGTCLKLSNAVIISDNIPMDPDGWIIVSEPEGVTVTPEGTIDLCNISADKIVLEMVTEYAGLSPQYQWSVNSTDVPGATGKTFELTSEDYPVSGGSVDIECKVTADIPCALSGTPTGRVKILANETPEGTLDNPTFCENTTIIGDEPEKTVDGYTVLWYEDETGLTGESVTAPLVRNLPAGTHTFYYKVAHSSVMSCQSAVHEYIVTVDTVPEIYTNLTQVICSGEQFNVAPADKADDGAGNINVIPVRTEYTWVYNPAKSDSWIKGLGGVTPPNSTGRYETVSGHLETTDNRPGKVTYTVTPVNSTLPDNVADCQGNAFEVTVTVNPVPNITNDGSLNRVICSGSAFTVTTSEIQSITGNIVPAGTQYDWVVKDPANPDVGGAGDATGQSSISQILTNATNAPQNVTYVVTPKFTNDGVTCGDGSNSFELTVTVTPIPSVINTEREYDVCSGLAWAGAILATNVSGTTTAYYWKSYATGGVTGNTTEGSGDLPKDILSLPEGATAAGSVIYRVVPKSGTAQCAPTDSVDFIVTVKPLPQIEILPVPSVACSDYDTIIITTDPSMSQYVWGGEIQESDGATIHSGNGTNQIKISWVNTTGAIDYKTVTVNYVATNGCTAVGSASVDVPVHPEVPKPVFSSLVCDPLNPGTARIEIIAPINPPVSPALYEYSLNGGAFQSGVAFDVLNGVHTITVRNISNGCINSAKTPENTCGCVVSPTVEWGSGTDFTCENSAIQNTVTYGGTATEVTITHNGAGSIVLSAGSSPKVTAVTYTPVPADYGKTIVITATTDHPGSPCTFASDQWSVYVKPFSTAGNIDVTEVTSVICNESDAHIKVTAINVKNTVIFRLYGYKDEFNNGENYLIDEESVEGTGTQYTFEFTPKLPTTNSVMTIYDFWVSVEGADYCEGEKVKVPVTVRPNATDGNINVTAKTDTICDGGTASFTVEAVGVTGAKFTWYNEDNTVAGYGTSFTSDILYSSTGPVAPKEYKFYVSVEGDNYCAGDFRKELTVTVKPKIQEGDLILTDVSNKKLCEGDNATLTALASLVKDPVYTWYYNDEEKLTDRLLGTNQTSIYSTDLLSAGIHRFYVTVSGSNYCAGSVRKPVQVTVNPYATDEQLTAVAEKDSICNGSTAKFTATAKGVFNPVYRWYDAPVGGNKVDDSGKLPTNATHTYSPVLNVDASGKQTTYTFYVTVEGDNFCESSDRVPVSVKVNPYSTTANVVLAVENNIICNDSLAVFTASASGITNPVYKWYDSSNTLIWEDKNSKDPLSVSTYEVVLKATVPGTVYTYYVAVLGDDYCEGNNRAPVSITVNPHSTPDDLDVKVEENTICDGQTAVFTATAKDYVTVPVYSWYKKNEEGEFEFIQNGAVYAPVLSVDPLMPNQRKTYTFYVSVSNDDYCEGDDKASIGVTVKPFAPAGILDVSQPNAICDGEQATFTAEANGVLNPVFRWYADGHTQTPDPVEDKQLTGGISTFTPSLSVTGDAEITYKFNVSVEGENYCEGAYREPTSITVNPLPRFYDDSFDDLVHCAGETVKVDFNGKGVNLDNIKWTNSNEKIGLPASGQGIIEFEADNVADTEVATIIVFPVSAAGCENPAAAGSFTITVNPLPNFDVNSIEDLTYCAGETTVATDFKGNHLDPDKVIWEITNYDETGDIGLGRGSGTGNIPSFKAAGVKTKVVAEFKIIPVSDADVRACENPDGEKTFIMTINPLPVITVDTRSETNSTCSGVDITIITQKEMSNYEWTVEAPGKITSCVGPDCADTDSITVQWTGFERDTTMRVWVNYSDGNTTCRAAGPAEIEVMVFADVETPVLDHTAVCNDVPAGTKDIRILLPHGDLYEYSLNGGAWQKEPLFPAQPNGAYRVVARKLNSNGYYCESAASDEMKYDTCGCETPPTVAWEKEDSTSLTCEIEPASLNITFGGTATEVTLTHDGDGTLSQTVITGEDVQPVTITYTPALSDTAKIITVKAVTNNPASTEPGNEYCVADTAFWWIKVNPYATENNFEEVSVSRDSICDEQPVVFTAKTKGVLNPVIRWYNRAGTVVHEEQQGRITSTYIPDPALRPEGGIPTEYTFFVSVEGENYCEGDYRDSVSVTVKPYATESNLDVVAVTDTVCDGGSAKFEASSQGVSNPVYTWYESAVDTVVYVGEIFEPELKVKNDTLTVYEYYVSVQGDNYCEGNERDTVRATVKPYAAENNLSVFAVTDTVCDGGSVKFEASSQGVSNPVYTWYESVVDTVVYVGEIFEPELKVKNDTLTVYEYYVSVRGDNYCEGAERDTVRATVKPYAAESNLNVAAVADTVCDGGSAKFEASSQGVSNPVYTWYESVVDTVVYVGEIFEPELKVKNDTLTVYEYYISVQGDNYCEGNERDTVRATVKPYAAESNLSVAAVTDSICDGGSAKFEASSRGVSNPVYTWYESVVDTVVYVGEIFEPELKVKNDTLTVYEHYVSVRGDNYCEGAERDTVTVEVKPYSDNDGLIDVSKSDSVICTGTTATLIATAEEVVKPVFRWYATADDVTEEPIWQEEGDISTFVTMPLFNDTVFYVTVSGENYCEDKANRKEVTVKVRPLSDEGNIRVTVDAGTICAETTVTLTATAIGVDEPVVFYWYDSEDATEPVKKGNSLDNTYTTTELTANSTFYVSVSGGNFCEGAYRADTSVTVKPLPEFLSDTLGIQTVCAGSSTEAIEFTGINIDPSKVIWTNNNPEIGLDASGTGNIPAFVTDSVANRDTATITVYPVSDFGCENLEAKATYLIIVNPLPAWTPNLFENLGICAGDSVFPFDFTGTHLDNTKVTWTNSNTAIGLSSRGEGNIPDFVTNANIVKDEVSKIVAIPVSEFNCANLSAVDSFWVQVYPLPERLAPSTVNIFIDNLPQSINKNGEIHSTSDHTLYWYTDTTKSGSEEAPIQYASDKDTYLYWVRQLSRSGCWSAFTEIRVNILRAPLPSVISPAICKNEPLELTDLATADAGHTLYWYTDASAPKGTGHEEAPFVSTDTTGILTYYVSQKNDETEAESDKIRIDITVIGVKVPFLSPVPSGYCAYQEAPSLTAMQTVDSILSPGGWFSNYRSDTLVWYQDGEKLQDFPVINTEVDATVDYAYTLEQWYYLSQPSDKDTLEAYLQRYWHEIYESDYYFKKNTLHLCKADTSLTLHVEEQLNLTLTASSYRVREGSPIDLIVNSTGDNHTRFKWYQNEIFLDSTFSEILKIDELYESSLYRVSTSNEYCEGWDTAFVEVEIFVPNIITPNNSNGMNDSFMVGSRSVLRVEIFNRYQQKIYDASQGWDGTYRGEIAEPGTYYYRLQMKDGSIRKGTLEVAKF